MADGASRQERTRLTSSEFLLMLLLVIGGSVAGMIAALLTAMAGYKELSNMLWGAAVTLVFGSLLGGVVTLLIADFDRRRAKRAAQMDFIGNVLSDLKSVNDRVDRARTLIRARKSAKTYGEEMLNLIDARVVLKNVERALKTDERSAVIQPVLLEVESMDGYLRSLLDEYEMEYKAISLQQSAFEVQLKEALAKPEEAYAKVSALENTPWLRIESLAKTKDFLAVPSQGTADASGFARGFLDPLDRASERLRRAIADQLKEAR
ncbi:MAG TPA: hypothetical protein VIM60_08200 [Edaphobacter sp.]